MARTVLYSICFSEFYGTQQNILSTARCLDPEKYTPIVAAPYGERFFSSLREAGIMVVPLPFNNLFDMKTALALKGIIKNNNVSIIHAHLGISTFLSLAASAFSGGIPVLATRHFLDDRYTTIKSPALSGIYRNVYSFMNHRLKKVVFVSKAVREAIEKREGSVGTRGIVIPNGINLSGRLLKVDISSERQYEIRRGFGVPKGRKLAASLSRLAPEKGLHTLVEAAAVLKKSGANIFFAVAGGGPMKSELELYAEKLGVGDDIKFLGYINEVEELLAASDIFFLCSSAEPFGISILEAMVAGLPVIVARGGGPCEIITDGIDGLFFNPGDALALAQRLELLANDPELSRRLVEGAFARVSDFDERKIAGQIQDLYDDVPGGAN